MHSSKKINNYKVKEEKAKSRIKPFSLLFCQLFITNHFLFFLD